MKTSRCGTTRSPGVRPGGRWKRWVSRRRSTRCPRAWTPSWARGAARLSYGQTQLLSLARALAADPPVLLLDELTSGLDAVTERKVLDAVRALTGSGLSGGGTKTILTVSHRLSGLLDVDTVHIMEKGHIVESGSPAELSGREGWYARYKRLEDLGWKIS